MTRHYGLSDNPKRHYPGYAPKVILHRVRHRLFGPLLGCSCTGCFDSRWRIVPAAEFYRTRVNLAKDLNAIKKRLKVLESNGKCLECGSPVGKGHTGMCSKSMMRGGPGGVVTGVDAGEMP